MKEVNKGRKYNTSTKGFKIDVYLKGIYMYSTDIYKTCRAAKDNFIKDNPGINKLFVTANFDKI